MKPVVFPRWAWSGAGAVALLAAVSVCPGAVLLKYEMNQVAPNFQDPANSLEGGPLLAGSGVGNFTIPSALPYPSAPIGAVWPAANVLPLNNASAALAANCLIYFDVRVGAEVAALNLQSLTLDLARGGANTNRGFGVFITTPTTADVLVQPSTYVLTQRYTWDSQTIDLSGVASLQGLQAGEVFRVKIPFWTADAGQSLEFDNVTLLGTVQLATNQPAPLPIIITAVQRQPDFVNLTWRSEPGKAYAVEYSGDLQRWDEFPTNIIAGPGSATSVSLDTTPAAVPSDVLLLEYRMGQLMPHVQNAARTAAGGNLIRGAGFATFDVNFNQYPSTPSLLANFVATTADVATALTNDSVIAFDLTVGTNVPGLALTSLSFNAARGGSSTPRGYGVYVTTPTSTNQLVQSAATINSVRPNWAPQFVNLTNVISLQNLTAGQVVRFTLALFSPATGSSVELDDLTVRGVISPPPAYLDAAQLYLRVRELPGAPILVECATRPTGAVWNLYPTRTLAQLPSSLSATRDEATSFYGGLKSFQTNATGFFYPLKIEDRWWLIDPQGYLFLHKAVAVVSTVNSPDANTALTTKFGNASNWAIATSTLLRQHGFNGAGAWSDNNRLKNVPLPLARTAIANFLSTYAATNAAPGYPQVFDSTFAPFCQAYAQQFAATKNEASLIGYYSDNELDFPATLLTNWLALPPGNSSYDEAWRWLRERYGPGATAGQVTGQDQLDFLGQVWGRYYSVVNQAIKQHDPNHLYLGSRFFYLDKDRPEIFRAIGPHVDVISVNHYSQWTPDINRIRMWEQESGRPVFITEYYVKGEDSGMPNNTGAGWVVRTQNDRGLFYQNFVLALLESKVCVGWHWFKYADNDPDSNPDPSNIDSNKGIVSNRYEPYLDLLDDMLLINERTYQLANFFDGGTAP